MNRGMALKATLKEAVSIMFSLNTLEASQPNRGKVKKLNTSRAVLILIICVFVREDTKGTNPFIKTRAME